MIRNAVVDDADTIAKVHVDTWRSAYQSLVPSEVLDSLSYEQRSEYWSSIISREDPDRIILIAEEETNGVFDLVRSHTGPIVPEPLCV